MIETLKCIIARRMMRESFSANSKEKKDMKGLNQVQLLGYVGKDCEIRYTQSGVACASFSLATTKEWKDADGNKQSKTSWHNIIAYRKLAEVCGQYVKKGDPVHISGEISYEEYEKDGQKKYITKIIANDLIMLGTKDRSRDEQTAHGEAEAAVVIEEPRKVVDDLPF